MAKKTLLQLVQDVLNDMDSDDVNSINDTVESTQVAQIVRTCYEEILSNRNWPHLKKLIQLDASGTLDRPNYLRLPEGTKEMIRFEYDKRKLGGTKIQYRPITYLYPDEFLKLVNDRDSDKTNIILVSDTSGITLSIVNDKAPDYWTSFDDEYIVCDSYDAAVDSTLQKAKTQSLCYIEPAWSHTDSFIPDLPSEAFSLLQEESKSTAFLALKQMPNQKAEMKAGRQQRWLSRKAWKTHGGIRYESYGRKDNK